MYSSHEQNLTKKHTPFILIIALVSHKRFLIRFRFPKHLYSKHTANVIALFYLSVMVDPNSVKSNESKRTLKVFTTVIAVDWNSRQKIGSFPIQPASNNYRPHIPLSYSCRLEFNSAFYYTSDVQLWVNVKFLLLGIILSFWFYKDNKPLRQLIHRDQPC